MKIGDIERVDKKRMYKVYDEWPENARKCINKKLKIFNSRFIDHIVFSGMGGSGSIGDVITSILSKEDIHITTIKGYHLPSNLDSNSLIIAISVSGNTEETLTTLRNAINTDSSIAAFSSGGKMEDFCHSNNVFHQKIEAINSPRASFPTYLFTILKCLENVIPIKPEDITEAIDELEKTREIIYSGNLGADNPALKLAEWIKDIPLIYYPWGLESPAIRFKNSLQENSKIHVITEDVVEASHNGIVAWEKESSVKPILIRGQDDYVKTIERWEVLKEFFDNQNINYFEVNSIQGSILSKIVNLIYLLDYSSIYHAVLNNIDPTPVKAIEFMKNRID
tara:strand:- start:1856 stop:2866 length:1011 start_codon:yes stop_codon:yes gene_type:complete